MQSLHGVVLIYRIHDSFPVKYSNSSCYVSVSPDVHAVYNMVPIVPALKEYNYYAK